MIEYHFQLGCVLTRSLVKKRVKVVVIDLGELDNEEESVQRESGDLLFEGRHTRPNIVEKGAGFEVTCDEIAPAPALIAAMRRLRFQTKAKVGRL